MTRRITGAEAAELVAEAPCPGCAGQPVALNDPSVCYECWDREREHRPPDRSRLIRATPVTLRKRDPAP